MLRKILSLKNRSMNKKAFILKRLPKESWVIIRSESSKQKATSQKVKKIFKRYGEDISALSRS